MNCSCCKDCGIELLPVEREMYEFRCDGCERAWHERVQRWRAGYDDQALDEMFETLSAPRVLH